MLPLIQQIQADLQSGKMDPPCTSRISSRCRSRMQVCRRIFGGMLSFARGGARRTHHGQVQPALDTTLAVLKDGMERRGIDLVVETKDDLPPVACGQSDLEQVFLNLLTNAREASSQGGQRHGTRRAQQEQMAITVADTGCGIAPEASFQGVRAVLHDQGQRQRAGTLHLPLDPLGDWRHAEPAERAAQGHARPRDRALGVSAPAPARATQ